MSLKALCKTTSVLLLILWFSHSTCLAKMYRWTDDQGKVHFSDVVPPDQVKYQRDMLNKDAQVTSTLSGAKTAEQYLQEQHLAALRQEQEKLIAKQAAADQVLLSTYRSLDDLNLTLNGRMQALDAQRRVAEGNLTRLQRQLESQQQQVAENERNGQPIPKALLKDIVSSEEQIRIATDEINTHIGKKNKIKAEFEANISRFKYLTRGKTADAQDTSVAEELSGLFNCISTSYCEQAWQAAKVFVERYSTTPLTSSTEQLILSQEPRREQDLSLSVSRMQVDSERQKLFLDIRCHHSNMGAELCVSKQANTIRAAFKPFLNAAVK